MEVKRAYRKIHNLPKIEWDRVWRRAPKVSDDNCDGTRLVLDRASMKGGSLAVITVLGSMSSFCMYMVYRLVVDPPLHVGALALFTAFTAFALPLTVWEASYLLPARLELTDHSARYFVNGRLREEIPFGPDVKAEVKLESDRLGPKPRAFDMRCDDAEVCPPTNQFLLLCGISLTRGRDTISISHEAGWQLIDFSEVWDTFLKLAVENDMQVGSQMWRYIEFRDSFQQLGEDVEPDIFEKIRALEH